MPLWYRVALRDGDQTGVFTQVVGHRRVLRLERDWNNLSTLKAGVTIATSKGASLKTDYPFAAAFDNNTSTFPDMGQPFAKIGVDLGGEFALAYVRAYPRQGWAANRMNNTICYASAEPVTGDWESTGVPVTPAVKLETTGCSVGVYTRFTADGAVAAPATWTALDDSFVSGFFKVRRVYDRVEVWIKGVESAEWTSLGAYTLTGLDNEVSVGAAVACEYARV